MHGLKQLVYDNQPFFSLNQTGKTNRELYILWKQNKRDAIFLLLYAELQSEVLVCKIKFLGADFG